MDQKTAIYCRISRDRQGAGLGVQRQEDDCRELADNLGWTVAAVFVDNDISAYSGKRRPAYEDMLDQMSRGRFHGVIAWHTDRLHRSPLELETYIDVSERGSVTTHTVKAGEIDLSSPSGRAVARTLGAWARYESEHKSERIKRKRLELATAGKNGGGPTPYGYRIENGTPEIIEDDATEIRKAYQTIINGGTIGSIVRDLNHRQIPTRRGKQWTSTAVRNMLKRPTYAGLSTYHGEILGTSVYPAILTEDQWRTASAIVSDPTRRNQFDARVKHLLSGLILCGECGQPMRISSRAANGRPGPRQFYYKCSGTGGGHASQTAVPVEEFIEAVIVARLSAPDIREALHDTDTGSDFTELKDRQSTLRARLDEAADSFADGAITAGQMEKITARVNGQLADLDMRLADLTRGSVLPPVTETDIYAWWDRLDIESKRAVISELMTITIRPGVKAAPRRFDPERVDISWK